MMTLLPGWRIPWWHPLIVQTPLWWYWSLRYANMLSEGSHVLSSEEQTIHWTRYLSLPHPSEVSILWSNKSCFMYRWTERRISACCRDNTKDILAPDRLDRPDQLSETRNRWYCEQVNSTSSALPDTTVSKWHNLHSNEYRPWLDQSDEGFGSIASTSPINGYGTASSPDTLSTDDPAPPCIWKTKLSNREWCTLRRLENNPCSTRGGKCAVTYLPAPL